jgi:putative ABC transport system permease protein
VVTAFVFGLAPALQMSRRPLNDALRDSGKGVSGGFRHGRLRSALVVMEVALSLALLSGAGLLIRSFVALQHVNLGFQPDHILVLRPALPQTRYKTAAQLVGFYRPLMSRLRALPGVTNVTEVTALPGYGGPVSEVDIPGKTHAETWSTFNQLVSEDFFSTLRVQFIQGRPFNETEVSGARKLAVINQTFVRKYLGTDAPLGAHIRLRVLERPTFADPMHDATFEVIGVVADLKNQDLRFPANPEVWIPYTVTGSFLRGVLVRTRQDPLTMINSVRNEIWAIDPAVASTINRTAEDFINSITYAQPRFTLVVVSIFAGLGLALVAIGVYSVIAYTTERQTHEIGIRMALGADRGDVLRLVINMGLRLVGLGAVIGLVATLSLSRVIRSQLWEVSAYDPATLSAVAILLFLTGTAACWIPARRATRVDPVIALRYE